MVIVHGLVGDDVAAMCFPHNPYVVVVDALMAPPKVEISILWAISAYVMMHRSYTTTRSVPAYQ